MSFPFIFESNFEQGSNAEWDSETDTGSQLDFPHYSELARLPWHVAAPFRGAYCMRATLSGGTADAFVLEGDIDIAADANRFIRFMLWISPDFTGSANDTIHLLELQSSGPVIEAVFGLRIVAATNVINFGIGETAPTSFGSLEIERGKWYSVELDITLDDGGSNDGTIDLYVTPEDEHSATAVHATQVASLDQAAVIQGVLGVQNHLATTTGTILFDQVVFDDTRVYAIKDRYKQTQLLTKSAHVFVGTGEICHVELLPGAGTDCVLSIYDTNTADTTDADKLTMELKNTANNQYVPSDLKRCITRGCYVTLAGTNPRALITFTKTPAYGSPGMLRMYAKRR